MVDAFVVALMDEHPPQTLRVRVWETGELETQRQELQTKAATALGEFGSIGDVRAVDALIATLEDESYNLRVRMSATHALGRIGDARAVRSLVVASYQQKRGAQAVLDEVQRRRKKIISPEDLGLPPI